MQLIVRTWFLLWPMTWAIPILVATAGRSRRPTWTAWPRTEFVTLRLTIVKCWTTRISLLTGLYHHRSDQDFSNTALIGEILKPAGYRTCWSGKHHASFSPHGRGFDHFSGFWAVRSTFGIPETRRGQERMRRVGKPFTHGPSTRSWSIRQPPKAFFATDAFTDWSLEWLAEKERADDPFFLYLAYNAPHWPLHAHPEDIAKYEGAYDSGYEAVRKARYERQLASGLFDEEVAPLGEAERVWSASLQEKEKKRPCGCRFMPRWWTAWTKISVAWSPSCVKPDNWKTP